MATRISGVVFKLPPRRHVARVQQQPYCAPNNPGKAPSHSAYIVEEYQSGKEIKSHWTKIGSVWTHEDGEGGGARSCAWVARAARCAAHG